MTAPKRPVIVPSFDDEAATGRKLAIICSKGNLDMAYPGLILANAALGEGVETHLFFTFWGFDMITKSRMDDLKFTPLGNTAMHLPIGDVRVPQALHRCPACTAMATHDDEEADRRPRRARGARVPRADRRRPAVTCGPAGCRADMMHLTRTTCTRASRASSARPTSSR